MKILGNQSQALVLSSKAQLAAIMIVSMLLWMTGMPSWLPSVRAAALVSFSDTLSDSDLSALSVHRIQFTTTAPLDADDTIEISLDPGAGDAFTIGLLGASDFNSTTTIRVVGNSVAACGAAASEVYVSTSTAPDDKVTLTVCTGDTVAATAIAFNMGSTSSPFPKITNPGSAGSRIIRVNTRNEGGQLTADILDQGDARVFIIDDVVVTASVDSSFTFTISGVAFAASVNGSATTTSTTTTSVLIPFETLVPNVSKILAQDLAVTTNAANGFTVTVVQDQNLTSATGADIDLFINGATTSTPVAWTTPTNVLGQEATYGHIGITSEDATLSGGDVFGTSLWAGNISTAREVFFHNGPADGVTANQGTTRVGYQVEVESLQESGNDYTNTLTYVATPLF